MEDMQCDYVEPKKGKVKTCTKNHNNCSWWGTNDFGCHGCAFY